MKFAFTTLFFTIGSAFAYTIGFQVKLQDSNDGQMLILPLDGEGDKLYTPGDYYWTLFLAPTTNSETNLTNLATITSPTKYVNVDENGFLVLADTGYGFTDDFSNANLQNVAINGIETFYLIESTSGDSTTYNIQVLSEAPEGGNAINLGAIEVLSYSKRNRLGQELHFNKFIRRN